MKDRIIEIFKEYSYTDNHIGNIVKECDWSEIAMHITYINHNEPCRLSDDEIALEATRYATETYGHERFYGPAKNSFLYAINWFGNKLKYTNEKGERNEY